MTHNPLPFLSNGIAQTAIIVPDLEAAVEAYWTRFGVGPWHFYTYARPLLHTLNYGGQPVDSVVRIALSYAGPSRLELIEVGEGPSIYADYVRDHGYGVQHLGVLVEDMESALDEARAAGFTVLMEGAGFGLHGDGHYAYLDTEALLGVCIELIQRPSDRHEPEKVYP